MPVYEYTCKDCGQHLEVAQSFKDEPLTTCPNCGGPLRKVFGSIGIMFKGSGFYRTDSRVPSGKKPSKDGKDTAEVGASASADGASGSSSGEGGKTASEGSGSSEKAASPSGDGPGNSSKSGAKSSDKSTAKTA